MSATNYTKPSKYVPPEIGPRYEEGGVLFVARDPGQNEVEQGRPLVGSAGQIWQNALSFTGLRRSEVAIVNRVPVRPWNNDFWRHDWSDINEGEKEMRRMIEKLKPGLIVAMGGQAAFDLVPNWQNLTDRHPGENSGGNSIKTAKKITERRGFFRWPKQTEWGCPVMATLHPSSCQYQVMPNLMLFETDMKRIGEWRNNQIPTYDWPDVEVIRMPHQMERFIDSSRPVAFDIELKWGGKGILCIAFYNGEGDAAVCYWDNFDAIRPFLDSDTTKVAHNGSFDTYMLEHKNDIPVNAYTEDTIVAWWALNPELAGKAETGAEDTASGGMTRKSLEFLASWYLDVPYWKQYTSDERRMGVLCARDVFATYHLHRIMEDQIERNGVEKQYRRAMKMLPYLNKMQSRGMLIDEDLRQQRVKEIRERRTENQEKAREAGQQFLKAHSITHKEDGDEYWWYHDARCECCFGGSEKSQHCDSCAGIEGSGSGGSILKDDLVEWAEAEGHDTEGLTKDELVSLLPTCRECGGEGSIPTWDFNPMSSTQMTSIIFDHIEAPKYCYNQKPDASEETLKKVQEWCRDEAPMN